MPSNFELVKPEEESARQLIQSVKEVTTPPAKRNASVHVVKKLVVPGNIASIAITNQLELNSEDSSAPATSILPGEVAVAPKKPVKLKVVHNNQLNSVIYKQELSVTNASTPMPSSSGNLRFSRNASDNIIQIKLSLTN